MSVTEEKVIVQTEEKYDRIIETEWSMHPHQRKQHGTEWCKITLGKAQQRTFFSALEWNLDKRFKGRQSRIDV